MNAGPDKDLRHVQLAFLRQAAQYVSENKIPYPLRVSKEPGRHVLRYGADARTFCGVDLALKRPKYEPYNDKTLSTVCPQCREALASLREEAERGSN